MNVKIQFMEYDSFKGTHTALVDPGAHTVVAV